MERWQGRASYIERTVIKIALGREEWEAAAIEKYIIVEGRKEKESRGRLAR